MIRLCGYHIIFTKDIPRDVVTCSEQYCEYCIANNDGEQTFIGIDFASGRDKTVIHNTQPEESNIFEANVIDLQIQLNVLHERIKNLRKSLIEITENNLTCEVSKEIAKEAISLDNYCDVMWKD